MLDTGLDSKHTAFSVDNFTSTKLGLTYEQVAAVLDQTKAKELAGSLTVDDVYINEKVPFGYDYADRRIIVGEGDTLNLGKHVLSFVTAPMVHWPEVIMAYDLTDKILFSADAFGKFGALDVEDEWDCEARRYYIGIVGKYGAQVQALLKKAAGIAKASGTPKTVKAGKITEAQLREIAEYKMPDLNANDVEAAMRIIAGTAKNMGIEVVD